VSLLPDGEFATPIDGISALLPSAPEWFSYSSLAEAKACPRRWSLRRASYPAVWDGRGYPPLRSVSSVAGDVVHDGLERIVRGLVAAGCSSSTSADAVGVLRGLGGISDILRAGIETQIAKLQNNPRMSGRLDGLRRSLIERLPAMRRTVQQILSRAVLSEYSVSAHADGDAPNATHVGGADRFRGNGSWPEAEVRSSALGFLGRVDLLTLAGSDVHVVDYKTGAFSEHHAEQVRTYAVLWAHRDNGDADRSRATRLTLAYASGEVEVDPPSDDEVTMLGDALVSAVDSARAVLDVRPPPANPGITTCEFCEVRHLCDPYWAEVVSVPTEGFTDAEVRVRSRNGPRSWTVDMITGDGLLRCADESDLPIGAAVRVLGGLLTRTEDSDTPVLSLNTMAELYVVRP
jgi:hypothetical protein